MASTPPDHSEHTVLVQDLLLPRAQPRIHGRTDGLRGAHKLFGVDLGW